MRIISKGAEANIYVKNGEIIKERIPKAYRVEKLDIDLRKTRTKKEAKLISLARRAGVATPFIHDVDNVRTMLKMSFVPGPQIKKIIDSMGKEERAKIFEEVGKSVGKLHSKHIIHGDLTTSNMILNKKIYFIDFGLGEINESIEVKGVDILVFRKSLRSTHHRFEKECFDAFVKGYSTYQDSEKVLQRLEMIEKRGRYYKRPKNIYA